MRRELVLAAFASAVWSAAALAQPAKGAIKFELPVVPEVARHLELLAVPGYAALALENNGLNPSLSSRLTVKDRESFQIRAGVVRYTGKKGALYLYEAGLNLSLGVGESSFTVPLEVDTSGVARGALVVRVYPPLARLLPQELVERIEFKIRSLADLQSQRKMVAYFERLANEQQAKGRGFEGMLEAIVLEAYNRSGSTVSGQPLRDRGDAETLSDQAMLLATLAIWLVGFPVFLLFVRWRRKKQQPK